MDRYVTERRNGPIFVGAFKRNKNKVQFLRDYYWDSYGGYKWKRPKNRLKHFLSYASASG